jgi:hypothetical protein
VKIFQFGLFGQNHFGSILGLSPQELFPGVVDAVEHTVLRAEGKPTIKRSKGGHGREDY